MRDRKVPRREAAADAGQAPERVAVVITETRYFVGAGLLTVGERHELPADLAAQLLSTGLATPAIEAEE